MNFVNADRVAQPVAAVAIGHPVAVAPLVGQVGDNRGGFRGHFAEERERVGLVDSIAVVPRIDVVLVRYPRPDTRNESDPDARSSLRVEWRRRLVPAVEVTEHVNAFSARRPDGELRPGNAVAAARVRAHLLVESVM